MAADVNPSDAHTFTFQTTEPWLSNVLGVVSVNPTLAHTPGSYPFVLRVEDNNSADDTSTLFLDVSFSIVIKEKNLPPVKVSNSCPGIQAR